MALIAARLSQAEVVSSNVSLSYLAGDAYINPISQESGSAQVFTFEHAALYSWGKSFSFIDRELSQNEANENSSYVEVNIDISLTQNQGFSDSVLHDVYLASRWEHTATVNQDNLLLGAAIAWDVPGFIFLDTAFYFRSNGKNSFSVENDNNFQLSTSWLMPFQIGNLPVQFSGVINVISETDNNQQQAVAYQVIAQPQLKMDVGHYWQQSNQYFVGIEYNYWKNKYGIAGSDQSTPQILFTVNF